MGIVVNGITLNQDGKPRKKGSGKPQGAVSLAGVPAGELKKFLAGVSDAVIIPVGRKWAEGLFPETAIVKEAKVIQKMSNGLSHEQTPEVTIIDWNE